MSQSGLIINGKTGQAYCVYCSRGTLISREEGALPGHFISMRKTLYWLVCRNAFFPYVLTIGDVVDSTYTYTYTPTGIILTFYDYSVGVTSPSIAPFMALITIEKIKHIVSGQSLLLSMVFSIVNKCWQRSLPLSLILRQKNKSNVV